MTAGHASWLNMAEIEIGIPSRQCLDRRIPDRHALQTEVGAIGNKRETLSDARLNGASAPSCASSLAGGSYGRQIPEVGAVCLNWARTDLCGGCRATGIPTAIVNRPVPRKAGVADAKRLSSGFHAAMWGS